MSQLSNRCCLAVALAVLGASAAQPAQAQVPSTAADNLLVVNCLLPGQVRRLGQRTTYVSSRRPVRTTALDCRVRGGEYVVQDRANLKSALVVGLMPPNKVTHRRRQLWGDIRTGTWRTP